MSTPSFCIRFIKNLPSAPVTDDVVRIAPDATGFTWTFKVAPTGRTETLTGASSYDIEDRIRTMLTMVKDDDDPVKCIQVDVPGMPSVLLLQTTAYAWSESVVKAFKQSARNWPTKAQPAEASKRVWNTPCTDDMPPLTPIPNPYKKACSGARHLFFDE